MSQTYADAFATGVPGAVPGAGGALLITDRAVSELEDEFLQDAARQVDRLHSIYQMYPPRVRRMAAAPAILQLRGLNEGSLVASRVCGAPDSVFGRLFDGLGARCGRWSLLRKARWAALLAVIATAGVFALILMARITVQRYATRELWPGNWAMWFVMRGLTLLLVAQVAVALSGYGVVLQPVTGKTTTTLAALAGRTIGFAAFRLRSRMPAWPFALAMVFLFGLALAAGLAIDGVVGQRVGAKAELEPTAC